MAVNQVVMTQEMLQSLISSLRVDSAATPVVQQGNFSQCTNRFSGSPTENVECFIDSITVYKNCVNISDENAHKGLPMLLEGQAAVWYSGIKHTITSFDDVINALRHAFGFELPPHQIYQNIFALKQSENEKTEIFLSKCRSLFSQLPREPELVETIQLDMIYGCLHFNIRKIIARESFKTFNELIQLSRSAEITIFEKPKPFKQFNSVPSASPAHISQKKKKQCTYCKNFGHTREECRKFANSRMSSTFSEPNSSSTEVPQLKCQPTCFGCGKVGFLRSTCPDCKAKIIKTEPSNHLDFRFLNSNSSLQTNPIVIIEIESLKGLACLDTGARASICGSTLSNRLHELMIPYRSKELVITLADGEARPTLCHLFDVQVTLENKITPTTLISVPSHENSRTLLGADFIKAANIIIDMSDNSWFFKENPSICYAFVDENSQTFSISSIDIESVKLRESEGTALDDLMKNELNSLLVEFYETFAPNREATPFAEHSIRLTDDVPVASSPYRLSEPKCEILRKEIDQLLAEGTIEECDSAYASPVALVPKKDGTIRLCIDYRRLNAKTENDQYPMPRLDDLLHSTKQSIIMTTLDLKSGYHQISVRPCDRDKTAFVTPFGMYRYIKMPFGLKGSAATFQRMKDRFRNGLQNINILAYLDDLIIISSTFSEHIENLRHVFERLKIFKLTLNRDKCTFASTSVKYLGHIISANGIEPDPEKVTAISNRPAPQNVSQVMSFLQTCSWFRRFIENFAEISRPLSNLTKKNSVWQWERSEQEAFKKLKKCLTTSPILRQADPQLPYVLRTDASSYCIGACLLQGEGHDERPVEYASKMLTPAQRNYSTTEREAYAVVYAVEKFRGYLDGATVLIKTDHQPLKWLMSLKSPSGRLARWALLLQPYDLQIEYTPGRLNVIADTLSRVPISECELHVISIDLPAKSAITTRREQVDDPELLKIISDLESTSTSPVNLKHWSERGYIMTNGLLYRYHPEMDTEDPQLVVPSSQVKRILAEYHDSPISGHYGVERTFQRIASRYFWPTMRRDITDHVSKCITCQRYKVSNLKPTGLLQTPVPAQRFERLSMDLFGPLPASAEGYRWVFIIEDTASRWVELFPLKSATAEACARCLVDEIILRYGVPRQVISDNGVQFISETMQKVSYCLGFKQNLTPVYHPSSNPVERKNRDLKCQLSILSTDDHTQWPDKLPAIRFSMNTSQCSSTGYTPAFITFGRQLRCPDDVHQDLRAVVKNENFVPEITPYLSTLSSVLYQAKENHELAQDRSKRFADQKLTDSPSYKIGDKTLKVDQADPPELIDFIKSVLAHKDELLQIRDSEEYFKQTRSNADTKLDDREFFVKTDKRSLMHKREHRSNLKRNAYPDSHPQSRQPVNDVFPYYDDDKYVGRYERNTWNSIQRRRDLLRNDRYKRGLDLTDYNSDNDFGVRSVKVMPRSRTGVQNVPGDRYARRIRPQKCNAPINGDLLAKEYDYLGFKKSELSKPDINEGKKNIIPESVEQAQGNNNIEIKTTTNKDEVDTGTRDKRAVKVNIIDDNNIIESVKHDDKNHAMLLTIANKNNVERRDTSDKNTVIQILKETAPKVLHDLLMPLEQQPDFLGKVHNAFQILQDSTENSKRVSLLDVDQPTSAIEQHELSTKVADREDSGGWPFNGARDIQESTMFTTKSCDNFKVVEAVNMIHDKSKAEQPTKVKSGAYNEDSGQEEKVNQYDDESDDGYLSRRLKSVDYGVDLDYENGDKNNGSKIRVKRNFLEASSDYILRKDRSEDDYDEDSDPGGKKIIYDIIKKDQTKLISPLKEFAEKEMFAPINYDSKFARCDKCGENSGQCTCNHEKGSEKCSTCGENCKNCGTESTGSSTIASFNVLDIPEASSVKLSQLENLPDKNTLQQVIHQKEKEIKEKLGVMESEKIGKPKFFSEAPNILPSNHNKNDLHHSPPSTTLINEDQPEIEMAVNPAEVSSEPASESYMNTPENSDKGKDDETNDGELLNSVDSFSSIVEDSEKKINKRNLISESPLIRNVPYDRFTKVNKLWRPQYPINKLKDIINVRKVRSNSDSKSVQGKCKTPGAAKSKANKNMKQWTGAAGQPSRKGKTALSLEKGLNPNLGLKSINEGESGGCAPVADKSTAGDMHDVLNGKLPSAIVERVFNKIAEHPTLKTRFGLGLRRTHNYKTQMKNLDEFRNSETEEDIRRTEEMLGEILGLLNKIVLDQVHRRTCKRLSPELKDYLKELTGEKGNAEDDEQRTKINDEGMPLPLVKGTKIKTGSTPAPQGDFLFPNPDGSSPLQASEEKIKGKIKMIKELLEQYQKMSGHCKTKVEDIEAYLKKHLRTLNLMLKAIRAEDAAAAHASLKKCHPTKTKRKFVDTKSTSNTDDKSSTIRKSDSKYSDLVDRQLDSIGLGPKKTYKPTFSIDQIIHDKMRKMQPPKEQPHSPKKRSDEGDYYEHKSEHKRDLSNSGDVSDKYKKLVEAADTYRKKRESEERLGKLFGNTNAVKENLSPEHKDSSRFNEVGFEKPVMFSLDK